MAFLDFLLDLPLPAMFAIVLAIGATLACSILAIVRFSVRASGIDPTQPLPIRDSVLGATSALFALMMAFSAAGIWNDAVQARNAVQREANALENVLALAADLPADLVTRIREEVARYGRQVLATDWPAMARKVDVDHTVYDGAEKILVDLIGLLSREQGRIAHPPTFSLLLGQLMEARSARLARIAASNGGVTLPQWVAMLILASGVLTAVAVCNYHHRGMQSLAVGLYTLAASAAFFVILAHDRPFVGKVSVSPAPIVHLTTTH